MKSFKEYLLSSSSSSDADADDAAVVSKEHHNNNKEKKKWKELKEDQQVSYGWDSFKNNQEATEKYINRITNT